jgi:enoyl-CoA hydratase/carnithine racemase
MDLKTILYEKRGNIAYITLNRPERLNAMDSQMMQHDLPAVWTASRDDPEVRVIIITGAGERAFCSGGDVQTINEARSNPDAPPRTVRAGGVTKLTNLDFENYKPVICAVNGMAVGGGLHFVAHADIVVAAEHAYFMDTHTNVGQVGAAEMIPLARKLPLEIVMRMLLMGKAFRLSAQRAYELGLVGDVVPPAELIPTAERIAAAVCEVSPAAAIASKKTILRGEEVGLTQAVEEGYAAIHAHGASHPDAREGPRAFMEKRKPVWQ